VASNKGGYIPFTLILWDDITMLRTLLMVAALVLGLLSPPPPALASTVAPIVVAAHNGSVQVAGLSNGSLVWRKNGENAWKSANLTLGKNAVSNMHWNGKYFVATSFFGIARSTDGIQWTQFTVPAGQAFDPGNIISDSEFFKRGSMNAGAIQQFLNSKAPTCQSGFVCLKDYAEKTFDRPKSAMCDAYRSPGRETAAQIIARVSQACGVAAEVLIVLLQKEQSLVTHSAPTSGRYQIATGYACPDTAPCKSEFFGFYNQVYHAAKQFKRYANPPGTSAFFNWYPVGKASNVLYHPNSLCGKTPVVISNQATAGLYYYTPYTPNANSLQAFTGLGDGCSSYGNRNFWRLYNLWFNQTKNYETWYLHAGKTHLVIDHQGTVAIGNSSLSSWSVGTKVSGSLKHKIRSVGYLTNGDIAVVRGDGAIYSTEDGIQWVKNDKTSQVSPSSWVIPVLNGALVGAPEPPTNIEVSVTDRVTVSWSAPSGTIQGYFIYLLDRKGVVLVQESLEVSDGQSLTFDLPESVVSGLVPRNQYTIAVSASNEQFGEGNRGQSPKSRFTIGAPLSPGFVETLDNDGDVTVTWSPSPPGGGMGIIGYRVYVFDRKGKVIGRSEIIEPSGDPPFSVRLSDAVPQFLTLTAGAQYRVAVTAENQLAESARPSGKKLALHRVQ
jgi:hypothetical protein